MLQFAVLSIYQAYLDTLYIEEKKEKIKFQARKYKSVTKTYVVSFWIKYIVDWGKITLERYQKYKLLHL